MCHPPPIFMVWSASFNTVAMRGWPSTGGKEFVQHDVAQCLGQRDVLRFANRLVAEKQYAMLKQGSANGRSCSRRINVRDNAMSETVAPHPGEKGWIFIGHTVFTTRFSTGPA